MVIEEQVFWKDGFEGKAEGGIFFRSFELNKFLRGVEEDRGEVVGLRFDGNNVEVIVANKSYEIDILMHPLVVE